MNVTHLLNSDVGEGIHEKGAETTATLAVVTSTSPQQTPPRRTGGSRLSSRSRTPWSAGGFSLPLILDTSSIHTPSAATAAPHGESPTGSLAPDSPKSPEHKLSDSRSSQSSYTSSSYASSNNSSPHSRMSSLSTVSGSQYPTNPSLLVLRPAETGMASGLGLKEPALGGEAESQPRTPVQFDHRHSASSGQPQEYSPNETGRPASPSDVTLIKRTTPPDAQPGHNSFLSPDSSITRTHKRASSAPDFAAINATRVATVNPVPELLPQLSPQEEPQEASSTTLEADPYLPDPDSGPTCLYMSECDTGSQPRKAISHLFGRNKLCTRLIPDSVWVHFCRKHYQRDRYRNGTKYAMTQCDLVLTQIRRVQAWGDQNKRANNGCILQDWSLALRKREQNRIESKKRRYRAEDDEDEAPDRATLTGTAVPGWLLEKISDGYTTADMVAIVENIAADLEAGTLKAIPDIEILPNISTKDSADATKAKLCATRKRTFGTASHKRSQSVGVVALPPGAFSMARGTSHPNMDYRGHEGSHFSPTEKRQRIGGIYESYSERNMLSSLPLRNIHRTVPTIDHHPPRGAFTDIPEHGADDAVYPGRQPPATTSHYEYQNPHGPPPTLAPPRPAGLTMPPQLEPIPIPPNYHDHRRPAHQRSHSDVSAFHQSTSMAFRSISSTGPFPTSSTPSTTPRYDQSPLIESSAAGPGRLPPTYDLAPPSGYYNESPPGQQSFRPGPSLYDNLAVSRGRTVGGGPRHVRHQSTPVVPRSIQMFRNNSGSGAASVGQQEQPSFGHYRHQSYASAHPSLTPAIRLTPAIQETDQAGQD